jgi:glyoxylase-like metal-dependent hydrolase (beta-lactamase superfamily II)
VASGITVRALELSRFALDGGALHGIVPKPLWQRVHTPDADNRVSLVARGLLLDDAHSGARVLVELGMGQRWTDKERARYALAPGPDVPGLLAAGGVDPDTITHVVLTHLHWDHAGGLVRAEASGAVAGGARSRTEPTAGGAPTEPEPERVGASELAFPRAEHVVAEACLVYAARAGAKDGGSFRSDGLAALLAAPRLRRWHPGEALAPGMEGLAFHGHTEGQIVPVIRARDDGPALAVPTDLVPTRSHLRPGWGMAYDNDPRQVVRDKRALVEMLGPLGGGVLLYHDPLIEAAWTRPSKDGFELVPGQLDGSC